MTVQELREWWEIIQETYSPLAFWELVIDTRTKLRAGECRQSVGEIGISEWALDACDDEVIDLLLHEVAHALASDGGHGTAWRAMAEKIGADPTPYYGERMAACAPPPPYQIICPKCGVIGTRHRQSMDLASRQHRACGTVGMRWGYPTQEER